MSSFPITLFAHIHDIDMLLLAPSPSPVGLSQHLTRWVYSNGDCLWKVESWYGYVYAAHADALILVIFYILKYLKIGFFVPLDLENSIYVKYFKKVKYVN